MLTRGVKLLHAALPHHPALVQEDDAVHCRASRGEREARSMKHTAFDEREDGAVH